MKLSEVKQYLKDLERLDFRLPNGQLVPQHFHVTEVGEVSKHFIDCGGTIRDEKTVSFQLWNANDTDHRLKPQKLLNIIALSERKLGIGDHEVEVEYQDETIGKYALGFDGNEFLLLPKQTDCLASDQCGIPQQAETSAFEELTIANQNSCSPDGNCC